MKDSCWDRFDRIFCVHYAEYEDRLPHITRELERIGILDSGRFEMRTTYRNEFERQLAAYLRVPACSLIGSLFIETKRIMAESLYRNYGRILVIEDDAAFLKDTALIRDMIDKMPEDANVVQFEKRTDLKPKRIAAWNRLVHERRINDSYVWADGNIFWGAGCYSLNQDGMRDLDRVMSKDLINSDNCFAQCRKHAIAIRNLCIQGHFSSCEKAKYGYDEAIELKELEALGLKRDDYV